MGAQNTISIPGELLAQMQAAAAAEGKTTEEWLTEAVQARLEDLQWRNLFAYGSERARASGYGEEDLSSVIKQWRHEQRNR
jgi:hypothetical protein